LPALTSGPFKWPERRANGAHSIQPQGDFLDASGGTSRQNLLSSLAQRDTFTKYRISGKTNGRVTTAVRERCTAKRRALQEPKKKLFWLVSATAAAVVVVVVPLGPFFCPAICVRCWFFSPLHPRVDISLPEIGPDAFSGAASRPVLSLRASPFLPRLPTVQSWVVALFCSFEFSTIYMYYIIAFNFFKLSGLERSRVSFLCQSCTYTASQQIWILIDRCARARLFISCFQVRLFLCFLYMYVQIGGQLKMVFFTVDWSFPLCSHFHACFSLLQRIVDFCKCIFKSFQPHSKIRDLCLYSYLAKRYLFELTWLAEDMFCMFLHGGY
jgi:hypothetical protein